MSDSPSLEIRMHRWDRFGVWASLACAIHCLAAPLLFLALPTVAGIWAHPSSHALIALVVLPLACTVLFRGYRVHRKKWIAMAAAVGSALIVFGCLLPFVGESNSAQAADACASCCPQVVSDEDAGVSLVWPAASTVTILGSLLLIVCHLGNLTSLRCCGPVCGDDQRRICPSEK